MVFSSVFICYVVMVSNLFSLFSRALGEYHRPFQNLEFLEVDPSTMPCVPWDWRAMRTPDCTPSQNACDNCVESWKHPFCRQSDHDPARKPAQEDEMNDFLNHLATFLDLHFEAPEAMRCIWDISCLRWQFVEAAIMQSESHMKATFQNESNLLSSGRIGATTSDA